MRLPARSALLAFLAFALLLACGPASSRNGQGADAGAPPTVTVEVAAQCPAITPCAASPLGTWTYQGACVEAGSVWAEVKKDLCTTATISGVTGTVSGTVALSASQLVGHGTATLSGTIDLPTACLTHGADCGYLQDALATLLSAEVLCSGSSTCECAVVQTRSLEGTHSLAIAGSTFTTDPNTTKARTYGFCLTDASTLQLEETSAQGADPGRYTLGH